MKIIGVNYNTSKKMYWYKCPADDIKVGDKVVIEVLDAYKVTKDATHAMLAVVEVFDPGCGAPEPKAARFVLGKVDTTAYDFETRKALRKEQIMEEVTELKSKIDEVEMLRFYAQKSPRMAELLVELETM